jgi:hypothetical protein
VVVGVLEEEYCAVLCPAVLTWWWSLKLKIDSSRIRIVGVFEIVFLTGKTMENTTLVLYDVGSLLRVGTVALWC